MRQKKLIANNRKARHDFFIDEVYEAGIVLTGTEIKSIRQGKINLKESFAKVEKGEVVVYQMHISPYEQGNRYNVDPVRPRKLLLHKQQIRKLIGYTTQKGLTLVPLSRWNWPLPEARNFTISVRILQRGTPNAAFSRN